MQVSDIYPFISMMPIIKTTIVPSIPINRVLLYPKIIPLPSYVVDLYPPKFNVFYFRNIDAYVLNVSNLGELLSTYKSLLSGSINPWSLFEVNPVLLNIEEDGNVLLFRSVGGTYRVQLGDVELDYYKVLSGAKPDISMYLLSDSMKLSLFISESKNLLEAEDYDFSDVSGIEKSPPKINWGPFQYIEAYLKASPIEKVTQTVPLLVGHSGTSKSAILKGIVSKISTKYGLRYVDLRVSFMDKLDIEGYAKIYTTPDGSVYNMGPMKELVEATDSFLAITRNFLASPEAQAKADLEPEAFAQLQNLAKTPVLVFEEINRCPQSIRQFLTTLLNNKTFLNKYTLTEAKFVATANMPEGANKEEIRAFTDLSYYIADGFEDEAYRKRFNFIPIDPRGDSPGAVDIRDSWLNWASGPPYSRDLVVVGDSYTDKIKYTGVKDYDPSLVKKLCVVSGVSKSGGVVEGKGPKIIVYPCEDTTDETLKTLVDNKELQIYINDNLLNKNSYEIYREDLHEFDIGSRNTKLDKNQQPKKYGSSNIHPLVLDFINKNPEDLYNLSTVSDLAINSTTIDSTDLRRVPMTSFRSWEFVSNILLNKEKAGSKEIYNELLGGMLDKGTAERLTEYLRTLKDEKSADTGYKFVDSQDKLTDFLAEGVKSGIPVLLQGTTSIGKTARVNRLVHDLNKESIKQTGKEKYELFKIELGTIDRVTGKGLTYPVPTMTGVFTKRKIDGPEASPLLQSFSRYYNGNDYKVGDMVTHNTEDYKGNVFKVVAKSGDGKVEVEEYEEDDSGKLVSTGKKQIKVSEAEVHIGRGCPPDTTESAFSAPLLELLNRAKRSGKTIVFFVDELNRVQSQVLMSIVLEAISDKKIMGVDFTGVDIKVVAACNLKYSDTIPIDPAITARFLNVIKDVADISDYRAFLKYADTVDDKTGKKNVHPLIIQALNSCGSTEEERYKIFKKIFVEPDESKEDRAYSSTRQLDAFSCDLYGDGLNIPLKGKKLTIDETIFNNALTSSKSANEFFSKWIGRNFEENIVLTGSKTEINPRKFMESVQDNYYNKLSVLSQKEKSVQARGIFVYASKIEQAIEGKRSAAFLSNIDVDPQRVPEMRKFMSAIDKATEESIQWEDLVDSKLILDYFIENYVDTVGGENLVKGFPVMFKKAQGQFVRYVGIDFARWFSATFIFLMKIQMRSELTTIVRSALNDTNTCNLLSGIFDKDAIGEIENISGI